MAGSVFGFSLSKVAVFTYLHWALQFNSTIPLISTTRTNPNHQHPFQSEVQHQNLNFDRTDIPTLQSVVISKFYHPLLTFLSSLNPRGYTLFILLATISSFNFQLGLFSPWFGIKTTCY